MTKCEALCIFSSAYLDVSVQRVCRPAPILQNNSLATHPLAVILKKLRLGRGYLPSVPREFCIFSLYSKFFRIAWQNWSRTDFAYRKIRFPHSEIPGSKIAQHLPEAYRRYAASFIAIFTQGIHHLPLISSLLQKFVS